MLIFLRVLGFLLIFFGALVTIVIPPIGIIAIIIGIFCIIRSSKKLSEKISVNLQKSIIKNKQKTEMHNQKANELFKQYKKMEKETVIQPTIGQVMYNEREIPDDSRKALEIKARQKMSSKELAHENRKHMESTGLKLYEWSTSADERVRPSHALMEGKLCKWADPKVYSDDGGKTWKDRPEGATLFHPGEEEGCRCTALSYEKELFGEM